MNLSIVIATHADPLGLYLTFYSLRAQLQTFPHNWEIIIAADGGTPVKWEKESNTRCLRINTGSPQGTRDAGIRSAKYSAVLCIESHVIVSDIISWLKYHIGKNASISFPARIGETSELFQITNTETNWNGDLWIKRHFDDGKLAHKVIQFGHACMMIDREFYYRSGGYTLEQKGWGGEEPYLCLKTWMLGRECWVFPDIWFAHYLQPGAHSDYRQSENFIRNIDIVKYVMTGRMSPNFKITADLQSERKRICAGPFGGNLELLKDYFRQEGML